MFASCPTRLAPCLSGAALLLLAACGPANQPEEPTDFDNARGGAFLNDGYIEGHFETRIASMLDGTSKRSHHVKTPDGVFEIVLDDTSEVPPWDSYVRVPGEQAIDGRWEAEDLVVLAYPPSPLIDAEPRLPRRIGAVMVFWDGGGLPNAEANQSLFTGDSSTNIYYNENSYGIETMAGKTFGPYQIDNPGGCSPDFIANAADQAMIEKGWDPSDFTQMMYHFPGGLGCSFAGLASVGSPDAPARNSWYSGSFGCVVRNQELGHNYGMGHSHAYSCPAEPEGMDHNLYEDCEHIEYGHPYDPMGGGCGHMNVVQKTFMGWLDGCNVVTATTSGTFNLLPTEWPCNGTQSLVFPAYDGRYYHLEYRNGDGEFPAGSGVLVNVAPQVAGFGPTGYVLDELGDLGNGYLHEGDTFQDPGGGAMFTVLEEHDTHVVIQVDLPDGGDGAAPTCRGGGEPDQEAGAIGSLECTGAVHPADVTAPTVSITYPEDGQVFPVGSDFTITADAADDRQVVEVELYLNGESFNVLTAPPWEWDANNIPEGTYEFGVIARDARHWTPSDAVTIVVGDEPAPPADTGLDESDSGEPPQGTGDGTDTADTDTDTAGGTAPSSGCDCRTGGDGSGHFGFGLMVLGLLWLRRKNG